MTSYNKSNLIKVGNEYSDSSEVSGFDNTVRISEIDMFERRSIKVTGKETLAEFGMLDTYITEVRGMSTGTMLNKDKFWYSEKVKNVVKSRSETLTVVITPRVTSTTKTIEERRLKSYSVK